MRRKTKSQVNIWPGFVDAISTLLLVFIFLLAIFMISQTFLTQVITGKDIALENLQLQLNRLDEDLISNKTEKERLTDLLYKLNQKLLTLNLEKNNIEEDLANEKKISSRYLININDLNSKVNNLFEELSIEKNKFTNSEEDNQKLRKNIKGLNENIKLINKELFKIKDALSVSEKSASLKDIRIDDLSKKLNTALKEKIGELTQYRSEFFGKIKKIIGDEEEINIVGDRFVLQSEIFFKSGSADIGKKGKEKIKEITLLLISITNKIPKDIDWLIQVEGHTDNLPISNSKYPSNWELSTSRAISVAKVMMANGIKSNKINVAGYGEFRPLVENISSKNREKNRRIELKLTQP